MCGDVSVHVRRSDEQNPSVGNNVGKGTSLFVSVHRRLYPEPST